jgi:hypothetical protein
MFSEVDWIEDEPCCRSRDLDNKKAVLKGFGA